MDLKLQLDQLASRKLHLQSCLASQLRENPHVSLEQKQNRQQVDFKLGDVAGLELVRELETGVDEEAVKLREARQIRATYGALQAQIRAEAVFYEERIRRQRGQLDVTTGEYEAFTGVCDAAVTAAEDAQDARDQAADFAA